MAVVYNFVNIYAPYFPASSCYRRGGSVLKRAGSASSLWKKVWGRYCLLRPSDCRLDGDVMEGSDQSSREQAVHIIPKMGFYGASIKPCLSSPEVEYTIGNNVWNSIEKETGSYGTRAV